MSALMQCRSGPSPKVSLRNASRSIGLEQDASDTQAASRQISCAARLGRFSKLMVSLQGSRVGSNPAELRWHFPSLQRERWCTPRSLSICFLQTKYGARRCGFERGKEAMITTFRSGCKAIILYRRCFS